VEVVPRWANKRDANHADICRAFKVAGIDYIELFDFDVAARGLDGIGRLIEIKVPGREKGLTEKQVDLQRIFGDRFVICSSIEAALRACGRMVWPPAAPQP
jgi:hypothetical protein